MYDDPKSGYEARDAFGPHTIELKGMPMGRTPEYMQERLRRCPKLFQFTGVAGRRIPVFRSRLYRRRLQ